MSIPNSLSFSTSQAARLLADLQGAGILDDDEGFRADVIEGQTDVTEIMAGLILSDQLDEAHAGSIDAVMGQLAERRDRIVARRNKRRASMLTAMSDLGVKSLSTAVGTLSVRAGQAMLVMEADADVARLPDALVKIVRAPDRAAIKAALVEGVNVPGYVLSNGAPSLAIRSK